MEHGYQIHEHVFTRQEMAAAVEELRDAPLERTRAGARHVLMLPAVQRLAWDERMLGIARTSNGPAPVPFRATLFDKSADANWLVVWHQDTALPLVGRNDQPEWGPWSRKAGVLYAHAPAWALEQVVALRVSLDASTATNGPLRVLPDTHREGVLDELAIERLVARAAPVDCLTGIGGVVAMRPLTLHASSKATSGEPRRVLHIEYAREARLAPGVQLFVG